MKPGKKSPRRKLVSDLDKIFSLYIRARDNRDRGHCFFCEKPIEHNFHFITRAKYATRWDEVNCIGSCAGCNYAMEWNPHPYIQWFIRHFSLDTYEALILKSNQIAKLSSEELAEMVERYRGKLKEIV